MSLSGSQVAEVWILEQEIIITKNDPCRASTLRNHAWSHGCLVRRLRSWFIDCCFLSRSRSLCFWLLHFSPPVSLLKRSYFQVTFVSIICLNTLCDSNLSTRSSSQIFRSKCKPLRVQSAEMPHTSSFFEELVISFIWALHSALIPVSLF